MFVCELMSFVVLQETMRHRREASGVRVTAQDHIYFYVYFAAQSCVRLRRNCRVVHVYSLQENHDA